MIDYTQYETTEAIPEASSMIETFRAIGYSIEAAIADIIDNSISAGAENIWVNFDWKGSETWITIKDDGCGMSDSEIIEAMRPGCKNPLEDRSSKDLGRFGLGLKTASFSQCRKFSVISKKEGEESFYWTWDLDFVKESGKWELLRYLNDNEIFENQIMELNSGTIVIWNDIDRLVGNFNTEDQKALEKVTSIMKNVKNHLSMVFHRFIENGNIKIHFQDRIVLAWNPFMADHLKTQIHPDEYYENGKIKVKGYVLPHKDNLSKDLFEYGSGIKGWNEQQGFYIYRNERLLLAGDWLGLFRKEEHYKLARIQVDIPNSLDAEWQIDIKKSIARPPLILRDQLKSYAAKVRSQAVEVYRHKGKTVRILPGQKFIPFWKEHKKGDKWFYIINREHPIIEKVRQDAGSEPEKAINILLRFIEETIPTKSIYIKEAEESDFQGKPFEGIHQEELRLLLKQMYDSLILQGYSDSDAKSILINLEPFNHYPEYIASIVTV